MKHYDTHEHFVETYGEKYLSRIDHLRKRIVEYETGEHKFVVLPLEAGIGKSLQSDRIVVEYIAAATSHQIGRITRKPGNNRRFLIVKFFKEDVVASVERINRYCGAEMALGITSDNWNQFKDDPDTISFYPALVITHVRYLRLAQEQNNRAIFTEGRHTLIIDEAPNIPLYSFTEVDYRKIQAILPISLHMQLHDVCSGLFIEIGTLGAMKVGNRLLKCKPRIKPDKLSRFISDIEAQTYKPEDRNDVMRFVQTLEVLYNNPCLFNNGRLTSFDRGINRWGLHNNIILDANVIDRQYRFDENVVIDRQTPIISHDNWKLHHDPFNSSMSNIKRTEDYFDRVCELIIKRKRESDKILVVTQKKQRDELEKHLAKYDDSNISVANFTVSARVVACTTQKRRRLVEAEALKKEAS